MEKVFIFGPIIAIFAVMAILVLGFLILVLKFVKKAKAAAWTGTVEDKKYFEKESIEIDSRFGRKEKFFNLVVKLDNGERHTIAVSREFYDTIKAGDRLEKKAGELWPKKINYLEPA